MLNERTASAAGASVPAGVSGKTTAHSHLLTAMAVLEALPGLPEVSVTADRWSITFHFSFAPSTDVFPAVARVADLIGATTELSELGGGYRHFAAGRQYRSVWVKAFASSELTNDPVRTDRTVEAR